MADPHGSLLVAPTDATPWPPPPHDPRERALVDFVDGWQVRVFPATDPKFRYFVSRRLLHVQLWHPEARVSVLTPSRLTAGCFEAFPYRDWKIRLRCPDALHRVVRDGHGIALPALPRLAALVLWHVRAAERHAARAPASAGAVSRRCPVPIGDTWPPADEHSAPAATLRRAHAPD